MCWKIRNILDSLHLSSLTLILSWWHSLVIRGKRMSHPILPLSNVGAITLGFVLAATTSVTLILHLANFLNFEPLENQILMLLALKRWLNSSTNNAESSPFENFSQKHKCLSSSGAVWKWEQNYKRRQFFCDRLSSEWYTQRQRCTECKHLVTPSKDCLVYCRDHNFKAGGGTSSGNSCKFSLVRLDFTGSYEGVPLSSEGSFISGFFPKRLTQSQCCFK